MRWIKMTRSAQGKRGKTGAKGSRKRPMPRWAKRSIRGGIAVAVFALALAGPAWLWQSGWVATATNSLFKSAAYALADAGIRVDEVLLEGRTHESANRITKALDIQRGAPLMAIDLEAARIAGEEPGLRRVGARTGQHDLRGVDPQDVVPPLRELVGQLPRAATEIEDPCSRGKATEHARKLSFKGTLPTFRGRSRQFCKHLGSIFSQAVLPFAFWLR